MPDSYPQATNQELALMADRITDAVLVCDAQRCIRWANPAFTQLTGYTTREAYGRQLEELLSGPQTDAQAVASINQRLSQGQGIERVPLCQHHKNGEAFWVERTVQPLSDPDGKVDRYIEILTDLRAQRSAQQEHQRRLEAEVALARRTTFLGQLSQGIRGPLNTIAGFAQLMDMDAAPSGQVGPSADMRTQINHIQRAAGQLLHLLDKAITLAQAEDRVLPVHAQPVRLPSLCKEVCHAHEAAARDKRVTLVIEGDAPSAWADPVHVREIIQQLLRFSIRHCPLDGTIWVACRRMADTGRALIEVSHPGEGVQGAEGARLFQPFSPSFGPSGDDSANAGSMDDSGMGMAIAQRLAELMKGSLSVNSALGKGCMFTLNLPLADRQASSSEPGTHSITTVDLAPLRIIHVEDNALNRSLVEALFAVYPQVQLVSFATASHGLAAIESERPDVALIDINLPDGSGLDVCKALRAHPATRQTPLIALSADALPDHIARALQAGFNHYLVKPIQLQRLLNILSQLPAAAPPPR